MGRKGKSPRFARSPRTRKIPKFGDRPPAKKKARIGHDPGTYGDEKPAWTVDLFDEEGPWGREKLGSDDVLWEKILPKLRSYESMKWKEIDADHDYNHPVAVSRTIRAARRRLEELNLDDQDELYRLRMNGRARLWGIRERHILRVLWWDPDHEICPSQLRHT